MKALFVKRTFALCMAVCLILGILLLPVAAEENVEPLPSNVIFWAEDMVDKMSHPNGSTTYQFVKEDGMTLLELDIKEGSGGNDPYITFNLDQTYNTEEYKYITIIAKSTVTNAVFEVFFGTDGTGGSFVGGSRVHANYKAIEGWQALTFDMSGMEKWTGELYKLRFDYFSGGQYVHGNVCQIAAMILSTDVDSAYDAMYEVAYEIYPPVQSFSDFTEADLEAVGNSTTNTSVTVSEGDLRYMPTAAKDPSAWFYYGKLTASRKVPTLTTDDFRYVVMRYKSSMNILAPRMQLFVLTGDAKDLFGMIRTEGTYDCHYGVTSYALSKTYKAAMVDLAQTDGQEKNTQLMYGWQGRGVFTGFRFDYCDEGVVGSYIDVSDFLFYADKSDAEGMSQLISSMELTNPEDIKDWEDTYETEHIVMPWETETEDSTEETVPSFPQEDTEEPTEVETDSTTDSETLETENVETDTVGGTTGDVGGDTGNSGEDIMSGVDIGGGDTPVDEGSQTPFLIACIALAGLSVASIATVLVIRAKERA